MLRLAAPSGGKLVCGRIIHRSAVNTMALLGIDPVWIMPEPNAGEGLAGRITPEGVRRALEKNPEAKGVYLTSPDYYGVICDIQGIACVCKKYGVPLLVDNAHGAHLGYLSENLHPIHLGASMAACSAHKTLPVLTGGAWLQINDSRYLEGVKEAMSLFGSTSPSYLILQSLDACNRLLSTDYPARLQECCDRLAALRARLNALAAAQGTALPLALDGPAREPMKLTLDAAALGLTGQALADHLRQNGMECEYADPRYLVLMFTPENPAEDMARLEAALAELCARGIPPAEPPAEHREAFCALARQAEPRLTVRQAVFAPQETIPAGSALGRVCALPTVSCPPAIPIVVSGEVIGPAALELFAAYGVETVSVVKPEKF